MECKEKARVHINAEADCNPEVIIFDPTEEFFNKFCEAFNIEAKMAIGTTQVAIYEGNGFTLKLFCDIPHVETLREILVKEENQ